MVIAQLEGWRQGNHGTPREVCNQTEAGELLEGLQELNPTRHHVIHVEQLPAPGHGSQIVNLVAVCTCGWRSGEHQLYLGASTSWAEERARHQLENAGSIHIRSLIPPSS